MRVRTRSACVVLAWGILLILVAVGSTGSFRPAQANIRIASNTISTISTTSQATPTSRLAVRPDPAARPAAAHPAPARATTAIRTGTVIRTDAAVSTDTAARAATATRAKAGRGAATRERAAPGAQPGSGRYLVQPGDTLSGIAAVLGIGGGWPALYAANRQAIGPDPNAIRSGMVLTVPGRTTPSSYTVAAGDTLTGIAAALGTRGGWPALYAANRQILGPDPNAIRPGTVLRIPTPGPASASAPHQGRRPSAPSRTPTSRTPTSRTPTSRTPTSKAPAPATTQTPTNTPATGTSAPTTGPTTAPASTTAPGSATPPRTATAPTPASTPVRPPASASAPSTPKPSAADGQLPRWLVIVLIAAGLLIGISFLTEPVLLIARRRRRAAADPQANQHADPDAARPATNADAESAASPAADHRIVLADYDRLVVTASEPDGTVCVLRPPGADPEVILLAARLVLAEDRYRELAGHLGVSPHRWRE